VVHGGKLPIGNTTQHELLLVFFMFCLNVNEVFKISIATLVHSSRGAQGEKNLDQ